MAFIRAKNSLSINNTRMDALLRILTMLRTAALTAPVSEVVVTSIADGVHAKNSKHYTNEAVDIRSKNFPNKEAKEKFRLEFEKLLGPKFMVIIEDEGSDNEHFHAQVKKG